MHRAAASLLVFGVLGFFGLYDPATAAQEPARSAPWIETGYLGYPAHLHPLARKPYFELLDDLFNPSTVKVQLTAQRYELDLFVGREVRVTLTPTTTPLAAVVTGLEILDDTYVDAYHEARWQSSATLAVLEPSIDALRSQLEALSLDLLRLAEHEAAEAELNDLQVKLSDVSDRLTGIELNQRGSKLGSGITMAQLRWMMMRLEQEREVVFREQAMPASLQLAGDATVGSGVLIDLSKYDANPHHHYVLTSWHVVRDIYGSKDNTAKPIPAKALYYRAPKSAEPAEAVAQRRATQRLNQMIEAFHHIVTGKRGALATAAPNAELPQGAHEFAVTMVAYDVERDLALLMNDSPTPYAALELVPREALATLDVTNDLWAIGCPLGNDPIPTTGNLAAKSHTVDGQGYWMITAPTYIGNSGGAIARWDWQSGEVQLVSIFSKIYTHGSMRSTIVPHMGLANDPYALRDWLDAVMLPKSADVASITKE